MIDAIIARVHLSFYSKTCYQINAGARFVIPSSFIVPNIHKIPLFILWQLSICDLVIATSLWPPSDLERNAEGQCKADGRVSSRRNTEWSEGIKDWGLLMRATLGARWLFNICKCIPFPLFLSLTISTPFSHLLSLCLKRVSKSHWEILSSQQKLIPFVFSSFYTAVWDLISKYFMCTPLP